MCENWQTKNLKNFSPRFQKNLVNNFRTRETTPKTGNNPQNFYGKNYFNKETKMNYLSYFPTFLKLHNVCDAR